MEVFWFYEKRICMLILFPCCIVSHPLIVLLFLGDLDWASFTALQAVQHTIAFSKELYNLHYRLYST